LSADWLQGHYFGGVLGGGVWSAGGGVVLPDESGGGVVDGLV